jgi:hypothetical protein
MPWVFSSVNVFNFDLGYSYSEEQIREAIAPMLEAGPPPIVGTIPSSRGTDVRGYLTQNPGFRHSSSTTAPCTRPTRPRAAASSS